MDGWICLGRKREGKRGGVHEEVSGLGKWDRFFFLFFWSVCGFLGIWVEGRIDGVRAWVEVGEERRWGQGKGKGKGSVRC